VPANSNTADRYTVEVVRMAHIVPIGIDFWASAKSPDLLEPAMIPRITQEKLNPCMTTDQVPLGSTVASYSDDVRFKY
jgi:hypothetical protein